MQAVQDLDDAEFIFSGGRYNVSCFLAQKAAEKVLKAYLLAIGAEEVWGTFSRRLVQRHRSNR